MRHLQDYTTICNSAPSEFLATVALRNAAPIVERNLQIIRCNLDRLDLFFDSHRDLFSWQRPLAGSVAFPTTTRSASALAARTCRRPSKSSKDTCRHPENAGSDWGTDCVHRVLICRPLSASCSALAAVQQPALRSDCIHGNSTLVAQTTYRVFCSENMMRIASESKSI